MYNNKFKVIILTETWLSDMITDGILYPEAQYNIYFKDRKDKHGGVCIIVETSILSSMIKLKDTWWS